MIKSVCELSKVHLTRRGDNQARNSTIKAKYKSFCVIRTEDSLAVKLTTPLYA
jgi:hypothetical protein